MTNVTDALAPRNSATTSMSTTTPNVSSSIPGSSAALNATPRLSSSLSTSHLTATPVRAITSKISSRSTPTLPSPKNSYEPLVKSVFRHRLQFSLLLSLAFTSVVINAWTVWQAGGIARIGFWGAFWMPVKPWTISMTILAWASMALPITVLRKIFLTPHRTPFSSPLSVVKIALSQTSTRTAIVVHTISSLAVLALHVLNEYTYAVDDPKLTIFVKSRKHPQYLNGRLLLLCFTQVFTALAFVLRGALMDRFVYRWAVATSPKINWMSLMVIMAGIVSLVGTTLAVTGAATFFGLARLSLPILYKVPFLSIFLRPFTAHFLKGSWTILMPFYHVKLLSRSWFLSIGTFIIWEITDNLFDHVIVERGTLSTATADPNTTLVSGVTSSDEVFKFFAYSELRDLATDTSANASARRTSLFGDQKSVLNLWNCLSRESLVLLGQHYQLLLRRGLPPAPPPILPHLKNPTPGPEIGTPTKLLRQPIYKSGKDSPVQAAMDALASDGPIAHAVDAGADATHIPDLFRSVENKVLTSPAAEEAKKNVEHVKGLGSRVRDTFSAATSQAALHVPPQVKAYAGDLVEWWKAERLSKKVEAAVPFRELDVVIVDVLSYLTCGSLTEDRYGVVQRDIPKILEAMVSLLLAVEEYHLEVISKYKPPSTMSEKEAAAWNSVGVEVKKSRETLTYVADGLREGIARIVRAFGGKLLAFKFPPRTAQKLQTFLEYS